MIRSKTSPGPTPRVKMSPEGASTETGISRRSFLIGSGGVAGLALVGLGVWRVTASESTNQWDVLFGESTEAVATIGAAALDAGLVSDAGAAIDALPADGVTRNGDSLTIDDAQAFAVAFQSSTVAQASENDLVELDAWFFTPVELALAALVHLDP